MKNINMLTKNRNKFNKQKKFKWLECSKFK